MLPVGPMIDGLSIITILVMFATGTWQGTGYGWDDLDRLESERNEAKKLIILKQKEQIQKELDYDTYLINKYKYDKEKQLGPIRLPWSRQSNNDISDDTPNFPGQTQSQQTNWNLPTPKYNTIKINNLANTTNVLWKQKQSVCFPTKNWIIQSNFNPTLTLKDFQNETQEAKAILDHYTYVHLEGQPQLTGDLKQIPNSELGESTVMAKNIYDKIGHQIRRLQPLINILKNTTKPIIPYLTKNILTTIYPPASTLIDKLPQAINFIKKIVKFRANEDYRPDNNMQIQDLNEPNHMKTPHTIISSIVKSNNSTINSNWTNTSKKS